MEETGRGVEAECERVDGRQSYVEERIQKVQGMPETINQQVKCEEEEGLRSPLSL